MKFYLPATKENIAKIQEIERENAVSVLTKRLEASESEYLEVETDDKRFTVREEKLLGSAKSFVVSFDDEELGSYNSLDVTAVKQHLRNSPHPASSKTSHEQTLQSDTYTPVEQFTIRKANVEASDLPKLRQYFAQLNARMGENVVNISEPEGEDSVIVSICNYDHQNPQGKSVKISHHQHPIAGIYEYHFYDLSGDEPKKVMTFDDKSGKLRFDDLTLPTKKKNKDKELTAEALKELLKQYIDGKRIGRKTDLVDKIINVIDAPDIFSLSLSDEDLGLLRQGKLKRVLKEALNGGSIGEYFTRTFPLVVSARVEDALDRYIKSRENTSNNSKVALELL